VLVKKRFHEVISFNRIILLGSSLLFPMPTLSFSCPKCDKQHDRIKPEMVGHKVKCQCGFVFRLGSKADKQAWVADELKRKKALKAKKKAELKRIKRRDALLFKA
jgi:hypothetical protein